MRKTFDKKTKDKRLKIVKQHEEADRFIQGERLEENETDEGMYRGCFFGCMMQTDDDVLSTASKNMQLPERIINMSDKIFEGLPKEEAVVRPVQLLEAIPTDKDTKKTRKRIMKRILLDEERGNIAFANGREDLIDVIKQCASLYDMDIVDVEVARATRAVALAIARSAESVAWAVALAVVNSSESVIKSAESTDWYTARSTARSTVSSASFAAWAAASSAESDAFSAGWSEWYQRLRGVLIEELQRKE